MKGELLLKQLDRILEEKAKRSAAKRKEVKKEVSDRGGSTREVNGTVVAESERTAKANERRCWVKPRWS